MTVQPRRNDDVRKWNTTYPVGTKVRFWPHGRDGECREGVTQCGAWPRAGVPVIGIRGYPPAIPLVDVEVVLEEVFGG
jgi:hypothetical protein